MLPAKPAPTRNEALKSAFAKAHSNNRCTRGKGLLELRTVLREETVELDALSVYAMCELNFGVPSCSRTHIDGMQFEVLKWFGRTTNYASLIKVTFLIFSGKQRQFVQS